MQIKVGETTYWSKKELEDKISSILYRNINKDLNKNDASFVYELFRQHPNYQHKSKGLVVRRFFVRQSESSVYDGQTNYCFHFELEDGDVSDFSYLKCIAGDLRYPQPDYNLLFTNEEIAAIYEVPLQLFLTMRKLIHSKKRNKIWWKVREKNGEKYYSGRIFASINGYLRLVSGATFQQRMEAAIELLKLRD